MGNTHATHKKVISSPQKMTVKPTKLYTLSFKARVYPRRGSEMRDQYIEAATEAILDTSYWMAHLEGLMFEACQIAFDIDMVGSSWPCNHINISVTKSLQNSNVARLRGSIIWESVECPMHIVAEAAAWRIGAQISENKITDPEGKWVMLIMPEILQGA